MVHKSKKDIHLFHFLSGLANGTFFHARYVLDAESYTQKRKHRQRCEMEAIFMSAIFIERIFYKIFFALAR